MLSLATSLRKHTEHLPQVALLAVDDEHGYQHLTLHLATAF